MDKSYIAVGSYGQKFAQTQFIAHSWQSPNWRRPATIKPYAQLVYVAAGSGVLMISGAQFEMQQGNMFVIEPNQLCGELLNANNSLDIWFVYLPEAEYPELLVDGKLMPNQVNPKLDFKVHHEYALATLKKAEQFFYQNTQESVHLGKLLITSIAEIAKSMYRHQPQNYSFPPERIEFQILHYLYEHYAEKITLKKLAAHFNFSTSYLSHLFSKYWSVGPLQCLMEIRIIEARMLLCNTQIPIQDIAARIGYDDVHYFIRLFTKRQGMTPGEYRKTYVDIPESPYHPNSKMSEG